MFRERLTATCLLAVLGLAAFGAVRPSSNDPIEDSGAAQTRFFIDKAHQRRKFDGVIVGDSRALRGVAPEVLADRTGRSVFNFAFNAGGMNDEMYDAAEEMLDPAGRDRFILLAVTSLAFQPWKADNSQYHEYLAKPRDQVWLYQHAFALARWLQPVAPSVFARKALDVRPPKVLHQEFGRLGWIATDQTPPDDVTDLTRTREQLIATANSVDAGLVTDLMERTRAWTDAGIRVLGFIPPAYPPRVALEDSLLGFDRADFRQRFTAAGGVWLDTPQRGFATYDGSHLTADEARRFSAALGDTLAAHLR